MPRIAYLAADEADFYKRLDRMMDISARSLHVKRTVITKLLDEGLYPYTKRYLGTFSNHFSTIGLIGMNEAGLNAKWIKKDMTHTETQEFTKAVLNHMRERLSDYQEMYGDLYNLEATPAESTTYRLAKHDIRRYPDIITASDKTKNETPYYTNSSNLPVGYTDDIFAALDVQDEIQTLYTSGTVFHAFLGEKLPSWKSAATLIRTIAENYRLPYYSLSPTYSVCKNHGYIAGEVYECPHCGERTEVYSRITGYYRPVQNWNDGKTQEYKHRVVYAADKLTGRKPLLGEMPFAMDDAHEAAVAELEAKAAPAKKFLLFTTTTCPKCRMAKMFLDNSGIEYETVIAEEHPDLVALYGIKEAPTLVIVAGDKAERISNPSNIRAFCDQLVKA
jgi:ribonucleoside-triphosphate reductase